MKIGKKLTGIISGLMILCIVLAWMMPMQTQAVSQKRKAMKAYKKYLSQKMLKYYDWYLSTGRRRIKAAFSLEEAMKMPPLELPDLTSMQEAVLEAFPYDLWMK